MKVKLKGIKKIKIAGEHIRLDALLKYASAVSTGGEAKYMIQSGEVCVNNAQCTQRSKKIRPGDIVNFGEMVLLLASK